MKVQALIKMLERLEDAFGEDVDVSIRTASITLDGEKIGRIYCEELLPMLRAERPTVQQKRADSAARRQKIWKMKNKRVHAKIIADKFGISTARVHQICARVDREMEREKLLKMENAA
jgi:hypothetical protein